MNPEVTTEALAAAPPGSIIRRGEHVIAVKARVGSPWLRIGDDPEWSSSAEMATRYRGPHDRLVWPADTTAAQRRTLTGDRDGQIEAWEAVAAHPAIRRAHDLVDKHPHFLAAVIARLDELASLEGSLTEPTPAPLPRYVDPEPAAEHPATTHLRGLLTAPAGPLTVGEWAVMGDEARAARIRALTLREVRELGQSATAEQRELQSAADARGALAKAVWTQLHDTAEAIL